MEEENEVNGGKVDEGEDCDDPGEAGVEEEEEKEMSVVDGGQEEEEEERGEEKEIR